MAGAGVHRRWPLPAAEEWRRWAHRLLPLREDRAQSRDARSMRRLDVEPARPLRFAHSRCVSVRDVLGKNGRERVSYFAMVSKRVCDSTPNSFAVVFEICSTARSFTFGSRRKLRLK